MSDIRLQVLSNGNNWLEKELFNARIHLSVVFGFRLTQHKGQYFEKKNYFHLDHKNKLQGEIITEIRPQQSAETWMHAHVVPM